MACPPQHYLALQCPQPNLFLFILWFTLPYPFLNLPKIFSYHGVLLMVPSTLNALPIWLAYSHHLGLNSCVILRENFSDLIT